PLPLWMIRCSAPISGKPQAVADLGALSGDLDRLARGRKARVQMQAEIVGDETPGARPRSEVTFPLSRQHPVVPIARPR
ncbi:hypothetical protein UXB74_23000, partial [Escherichia marmotae]|nr:hypothetical protein [Escherichia marmotae]